jgi:hypothetical protein
MKEFELTTSKKNQKIFLLIIADSVADACILAKENGYSVTVVKEHGDAGNASEGIYQARGEIIETKSFEVVTPAARANPRAETYEEALNKLQEWGTPHENAPQEIKDYWKEQKEECYIVAVTTQKQIIL